MKILAFVDLHASKNGIKEIIRKSKKADIIVCAGDFTIFGNSEKEIIKDLDKLGKTVLLIHGNHEELSESEKYCSKSKNVKFIHAKNVVEQGVSFIGWGGGGFSLKDEIFERFVKKIKISKDEKIVLVSHAPPYGTKVDNIDGEHAGNKSIRKFIEKYKPVLSISGHLHENSGKMDKIGKCLVINPGMNGKILEI